jgi:hypothetical protein
MVLLFVECELSANKERERDVDADADAEVCCAFFADCFVVGNGME